MHLQTCCRFHYPKFSNTASSKIFKETLQDRNKFSNMSSSKIFEGFEWLERNGRFQFGGLAYFRTLQVRKYGTTNGRTGRQTDRQTDGRMDRQTDERRDGRASVLTAAALPNGWHFGWTPWSCNCWMKMQLKKWSICCEKKRAEFCSF